MLLKDIKGQDNAIRYLTNSISTGNLARSYLFSGPRGVGRALSAKAFIMALVCPEKKSPAEACLTCHACRKIENNNHPDVTWIIPEKNKTVRIQEVRRIKEALSLKPFESPLAVCVIEDAHAMTVPASNALLKILEEPQESSILILISDKRELLLETIISRCSEVRFNFLAIDIAEKIIKSNIDGLKEDEAGFLAYFSQGSPGIAIEIKEEGLEEKKEEIIRLLTSINEEEYMSKLGWIHDDKDNLLEDTEILLMLLRDAALARDGLEGMMIDKKFKKSGLYEILTGYDIDRIYNMTKRLVELKKALISNVNSKVVAGLLPGVFT